MAESVSVVIPTYNRSCLVVESVASALAQTMPPAEIIVVDDGSTDDTQVQLLRFGDRIHYAHQQNLGVSAARNHGIRLATSRWVAFLDSDDVWHPRKLERQLEVLEQHTGLGLLGTSVFPWPLSAFPQLPSESPGAVSFVPWDWLVVKNYLATSSVLARRDFLLRAGDFDSRLHGPEDRDMWLRIAELAAVANLDLPLTGYRVVPGSVSRQAARVHRSMTMMLRKLDERNAWNGRLLLRQKSYSHINFTSAINYRAIGKPAIAAMFMLVSLAMYPLPFRRSEVGTLLARPKNLAASLLHTVRSSMIRFWSFVTGRVRSAGSRLPFGSTPRA
jgi:glycosyltransferase involved in cell wall biosynthesis